LSKTQDTAEFLNCRFNIKASYWFDSSLRYRYTPRKDGD